MLVFRDPSGMYYGGNILIKGSMGSFRSLIQSVRQRRECVAPSASRRASLFIFLLCFVCRSTRGRSANLPYHHII